MNNELRIMLVSHSSSALTKLEKSLREDEELKSSRFLLNEEDFYPNATDVSTSDVVVVALSDSWEKMLTAFSQNNNAASRIATVVVGPDDESEIIKSAF